MPDRAGAKIPWLDVVKLYLKIIPCLPRIIASRSSVVDARVHEAGDPSLRELWSLSVNFWSMTVHQEDQI